MNKTEIVNAALLTFSQETITNIDDDTIAAKKARMVYDLARKELLSLAHWNFSLLNKRLELVPVDANQIIRYKFCYAFPKDCLSVIEIYPDGQFLRQRFANDFKNYETFISNQNKVILNTDIEYAIIRYSSDITDESLFEPQFIETLINLLAYKLCFSLSGNDEKSAELLQVYQYSLREAKANSLNNKRDRIDYESGIILSRNG